MRSTILTIAVLVAIASFLLAYYHNTKADKAVGDLNKERYSRMVAEEDLLKATEKADRLAKEVESVKGQLENSEKLLKQAQSVNKDLQARLDKAESMKETLEKEVRNMGKALKAGATVAEAVGDI